MAGVLETCEISRILSITAHPDDVDFAAAGTVARWTEAGIEVVYCLVTDGDAGAARAREPDRAHGRPDRAHQDPPDHGGPAGRPAGGHLAEGFRVLDTA